jgi:hypothetical protein
MTAITCKTDLRARLQSECPRWNPDDTLVILSCNMLTPEAAFWLWTPALARLERLVVSYHEDAATLAEVIRNRPPDRWRPSSTTRQESMARYALSPHTAFSVGSGSLVCGQLNGINTYRMDTKARTYSPLCRNELPPVWSYSPTPGLNAARDQLFTARWQINNENSPADAMHYSEIIGIELGTGTERVYARTPIADNIHQVAVLSDERHVLLNEFRTGLNSPSSDLSSIDMRGRLESLRQIGVKSSRIALVDLDTGDYTAWTCPWPAPAHIVFDPDDPTVFYLACHNMVIDSGEMYLFGPGCLAKVRILGKKFRVEGHYSHNTFHRLSTHAIVTCRGRKAIAVTVYPNRCEIIDAESFTRITSIELYPIARLDADGLTLPNNQTASAFSVCGTRTEDLLVLSGSQCIYVVDTSSEPPTVESLVYNEDPAWVVRAHMAKLS